MAEAIITKAALARALKCPRSRITQLVKENGLPARRDGRLNRQEALEWIVKNTSGYGGGWWGNNRGRLSLCERAQRLLTGKRAPGGRKPTRSSAAAATAGGESLAADTGLGSPQK